MTASPTPWIRPSSTAAAIPRGSSAGWFGCNRVDSRPARPMVLRNAVTTRTFCATTIRSWLRISFDTAATISGASPGATRASIAASVCGSNNQSRKSPTVIADSGANAAASWLSMISRVTSSLSYGTSGTSRKWRSGKSASTARAQTRCAALSAASPASASPDRAGEAAAMTAARLPKRWRSPAKSLR